MHITNLSDVTALIAIASFVETSGRFETTEKQILKLEKNIGDVDFFKQVVKRLCKENNISLRT